MSEGGRIGNTKNEDESVDIDKAEMNLDWDATRRSLVAAVQDFLRQEPRHAAQPVRGADGAGTAVAADRDRRQHRARIGRKPTKRRSFSIAS